MATINLDTLILQFREEHEQHLAREYGSAALTASQTYIEALYGTLPAGPATAVVAEPLDDTAEFASMGGSTSPFRSSMRTLDTPTEDDDVPDHTAAGVQNASYRDRLLEDAGWVAAHEGQWIAIAEGRIVQTDADPVTLQYQVGKRFPRTPCLIFPVGTSLDPLMGPSPRVVHQDDEPTAR